MTSFATSGPATGTTLFLNRDRDSRAARAHHCTITRQRRPNAGYGAPRLPR